MKRLGMVLLVLSINANAYAWKGEVHNFIAEKAGFTGINAACPDGHDKGGFSNHYYNGDEHEKITVSMIKAQEADYDKGKEKGELYGAILGSYKAVIAEQPIEKSCKPIEYFVHYMGDLSAPLHNIIHDEWAKKVHGRNDKFDTAMVDDEDLSTVKLANCDDDLLAKVAEIANSSQAIGYKVYNAKTQDISDEDKKAQVIKSINLLRGVKKYCFKGLQVI